MKIKQLTKPKEKFYMVTFERQVGLKSKSGTPKSLARPN